MTTSKVEPSLISGYTISGYTIIEQIYAGSKSLVYRAVRDADSQAVVVKILASEYPSFDELLQFRNQYAIAKNLNHPGIVSPLALEAYRSGYILLMSDTGGISLKEYVKIHQLSLVEFLTFAIQLADILHYLYQNSTIHKDIKPANILIHPETKQVQLIDFSIASLLPKETQSIISPNILEGTLGYISPEQTGRMNRGIDYRSDFYALGVTFFELLSGELPFISNDPMELVHCHIAKKPPLLEEIRSKNFQLNSEKVPLVISEIISKLMAKNAEDRYQSALGLKFDLENCLRQLQETDNIEYFEIGQRDICDRFIIPEKLYGREKEVQQLLEAFARVASPKMIEAERGNSEIFLVAGFSGIGKTVVVNEIHKPIIQQRGYFIKGKYDQFNRNIPFSAFVQAFRDLMGQLLTENDTIIQQLKEIIISALGENGQVIIEVIPELERIIGQQPNVAKLSGSAAEKRFNILFQKFIQVFTTKEHPLVIFLDDLQWADSASLKLIELLINKDSSYLLLIGAYRDNEVFPSHPLMLTLENVDKAGAIINTITLQPLNPINLNQLVADTLACSTKSSEILAQLVYQKTNGNPFFSTQFIKALYDDKLINFDLDAGYWQCDITQVQSAALTDDVVELMVLQLQKLPTETQDILKLAACIGNQFDLNTLVIISEVSETETAAALWNALQSGLILPQSDIYKFYIEQDLNTNVEVSKERVTYKFLHDRVQQAAYFLIPEDQKKMTHLKIGYLLRQNTSDAQLEEEIFKIINQLNIGVDCISEPDKRLELAQLNLIAGHKAKMSTAYFSAIEYLELGIELLPLNNWENNYDLTLSLYNDAIESAFLSGNIQQMESLIQVVLQQARRVSDTAKAYETKIELYTTQGKFTEAINIAMEFLRGIGIEFPQEPTNEDFLIALHETQNKLQDKSILELVDLPELNDLNVLVALKVLVKVDTPAYMIKPELHRLLVLKEINLSITYGNAPASAFAYAVYGLMLCGNPATIETGYTFGQLALQLIAKFNDKEYESRVLTVVSHFITHWKTHACEALQPLLQAYTSGLANGDLAFAGYACGIYCFHAYLVGHELTDLNKTFKTYGIALEKINQITALNYSNFYRQVLLNLIGNSSKTYQLIGEAYDEQKMLPIHQQANDGTALWHFFVNKLTLCYLFEEFELSLESVERAKQYSASGFAMLNVPLLNLYESLTKLAIFPNCTQTKQELILQQIAENQAIMNQWAIHAPMNFQHKFDLVEAERYRVLGQKLEAMEFYENAIAGANKNNYTQEEALANELAAKFYLECGKEKIAASYMQEAYYCYTRWGAKAKVDDLEKRYSQLLKPILQQRTLNFNQLLAHNETIANIAISQTSISSSTSSSTYSSNSSSISDALDFISILKATQAISSIIELDELINNLNRIILENSGAKKSVLILANEDTLQVRAITYINHQNNFQSQIENILDCQSIDTCQDVPKSIIYYVKNTQEVVVIDKLQCNIPGLIGEYMLEHKPQSVLCMPIINKGNLLGILYLENSITSWVFTKERLNILQLLTSQAAISLENAKLYKTIERKVEERTQELSQTLTQLRQTQSQLIYAEKMSSLGQMVAGIAHEINNPVNFIHGNLIHAENYVQDFIELIISNSNKNIQLSSTLQAEKEELDFLIADLSKLFTSMKNGTERIREIVLSLRTFSRLDEAYFKTINIHEGLESTLLILEYRFQANDKRPDITVHKNYGKLTEIDCFAADINQVFLNILNNAIDAIDEAYSQNKQCSSPTIWISTEQINNKEIAIRIKDNGIGISQLVKPRIFDPFFTTKTVGKGIGMGLANSYQIIVKKHRGNLICNSTFGEGSEFTITIPVHQSET